MPHLPQLYLFFVASLAILLMPGPAVLYAAVQSIKQGRIAGVAAVLGLEFGTVFHVSAAAFGVSTLLSSSITVFKLLKFLGTAYLIYLGFCKLLPSKKIHQKQITNFSTKSSCERVYKWIDTVLSPTTLKQGRSNDKQFKNQKKVNSN